MPEEVYDGATEHREHRVGAWLVLLVGITGFALGVYHIRTRIVGAFAARTTFMTPELIEAQRIEGMKSKDSDSDGITDFDETYVFKTSPYLQDSDSDGKSDKDELASGDNPNCPTGRECGPLGAAPPIAISPGAIAAPGTGAGTEDPSLEFSTEDEQQAIQEFTNYKPEEVRQLLKQAGISDDQLKGIDDETLMKLYRESLEEAQAKKEAASSSPSPSP